MKVKIMFTLACIFLTQACSGKQKDFDSVCGYFKELESQLDQTTLVPDERRLFIHAKVVENLSPTSDARIAWETIVVAEASSIYSLFVLAAESAGVSNWQCPIMEKLASTF